MAQTQKNKINAYSFAFHSKMSYNEISRYEDGGLKAEHKEILGDNHFNTLKNFCLSNIDEQRAQLIRNEKEVIEAHIEALFLLDSNQTILSYILPNLDGILYECPTSAKHIYNLQLKNKRDVVEKLHYFVANRENNYNTVINDSVARVFAFLLSEQHHYNHFIEDTKIFIKNTVITASKSSKNFSDYLIMVCLSHVLLVPGMSKYFLQELDGMRVIKDILTQHSNDLQIMYYSFLVLWILSFEEESQRAFSNPSGLIISKVINALKNISREKLSRIAFKMFQNISKWDDCVELMVDNNLSKVVENELKKNLKDEKLKEN